MHKVLSPGLTYFAIVFGAGFVLGTVRVLILEPRFGQMNSELAEMPVMLLICFFTAHYVVNRFKVHEFSHAILIGLLALLILLSFEFTLVLGLRGMSIEDYVASRNIITGSAYVVSMILYAIFPPMIVLARKADT